MSDRLPYELQLPQQWEELPLPDVNLAWADMKRRLEEDDDRKPLAWWQRGCMVWGFLLLVLLGTGWWIFHPEKWFQKKSSESVSIPETNNTGTSTKNNNDTVLYSEKKMQGPSSEEKKEQQVMKDSAVKNTKDKTEVKITETKTVGFPVLIKNKKKNRQVAGDKTTIALEQKDKKDPVNDPGKNSQDDPKSDQKDDRKIVNIEFGPVVKDVVLVKKNTLKVNAVITKTDTLIAVAKKDTVKKIEPLVDTVATKTKAKKDSSKKRSLFFSAGIALHQQLPVAGQKLTPYNALGRKGSLADYVPSVYFRLNRKDKWFLQAEFRYGAPQYNKALTYAQVSVPDTGQGPVFTTITSLNLKKTFYHQLPLTFNYFVTKNWSLGGGMQWNLFSRAIAEETVNKRRNSNLQDSIISKLIKVEKMDTTSVFKKSYFLAVIETEYKWKRFSAGARYTFGLQPYIRFSLPGGNSQEQKSTSLQIFLRYQLWRSKDK